LYGEQTFPVEPLKVPDASASESPLDLAQNDAIRLFAERTRAVKPDFVLNEANTSAVATICRRLDGLPLAIELAAARANLLSPQALLIRLAQHLPLLTGGARDLPLRLQTMHAAIAWSYDLLTEAERALFRRLAVFRGGCTLAAAEAVCTAAGNLDCDVFDGVASLVDKSLLQQIEGRDGEIRIGMLETLREFGLEQLTACGEEEVTRSAHAAVYVKQALGLEIMDPPMWLPNVEALAGLEVEQDNFRAALSRFEQTGEGRKLLQLVNLIIWYWFTAGQFREAQRWLERALEMAQGASPYELGCAHLLLGGFDQYLGAEESAIAHMEQGRATGHQIGDQWLEAVAIGELGIVAEDHADYETAEARFAEAVELGSAFDPTLGPLMTYHRGKLAYARGDMGLAMELWESAMADGRALNRPQLVAWCLMWLALAASEQGDLAQAAGPLREYVDIRTSTQYRHMTSGLLDTCAVLARATGEPERAARLLGASATAAEITDQSFTLLGGVVTEKETKRVREALGHEQFDQAWEEGRSMRPGQVAAEINAVLDAVEAKGKRPVSFATTPFGLTPREFDILKLLPSGRSNPQIAEILFISPRTVQTHLSNLYGKLGVDGRAAAIAVALREGTS
jgi:predicted ATPase/DNA-binding CsgD family transcriptional regulator